MGSADLADPFKDHGDEAPGNEWPPAQGAVSPGREQPTAEEETGA